MVNYWKNRHIGKQTLLQISTTISQLSKSRCLMFWLQMPLSDWMRFSFSHSEASIHIVFRANTANKIANSTSWKGMKLLFEVTVC